MTLATLLALAPRVADALTLGGRHEAARTVLQLADAAETLYVTLGEARAVNASAMSLLSEATARTEAARRERDALRAAAREYLAAQGVCPACRGRGMVLAGREVEEACDECVARDALDTLAKLAGGDRG